MSTFPPAIGPALTLVGRFWAGRGPGGGSNAGIAGIGFGGVANAAEPSAHRLVCPTLTRRPSATCVAPETRSPAIHVPFVEFRSVISTQSDEVTRACRWRPETTGSVSTRSHDPSRPITTGRALR